MMVLGIQDVAGEVVNCDRILETLVEVLASRDAWKIDYREKQSRRWWIGCLAWVCEKVKPLYWDWEDDEAHRGRG